MSKNTPQKKANGSDYLGELLFLLLSPIWTKPDDFTYEANKPLVGLGTAHPNGFLAAMADGSVHFIAATIDPRVFLRLLMMADGQRVEF